MKLFVTVRDGILEAVDTDQSTSYDVVCIDIDEDCHKEPVIVKSERTGCVMDDHDTLAYTVALGDALRVVCDLDGHIIIAPDELASRRPE